jgi:hypothetical protein
MQLHYDFKYGIIPLILTSVIRISNCPDRFGPLGRFVKNSAKLLVGKPEGKRPLGRPRRRREDNIKMDLQKVGGGRGDWMELAQDRDRWRALVGTVTNFRVP